MACLRFYTRLPLPPLAFERAPHDLSAFGRAVRASPLAGAVVGALGGLALALSFALRLPAGVAAALSIAALVAVTGVFHEDGLADAADGLGGGAARERKLEIMKDSRIGSYGAAALGLSLLIRWATLAALAERGLAPAFCALVAVHAVSRAAGLLPLVLLAPARADGAAFAAARPQPQALATAAGLAFVFGLPPLAGGASVFACVAAMVAACLASLAIVRIAARQIGGQTGDIAGAAQQVAEIAMLCVLSTQV